MDIWKGGGWWQDSSAFLLSAFIACSLLINSDVVAAWRIFWKTENQDINTYLSLPSSHETSRSSSLSPWVDPAHQFVSTFSGLALSIQYFQWKSKHNQPLCETPSPQTVQSTDFFCFFKQPPSIFCGCLHTWVDLPHSSAYDYFLLTSIFHFRECCKGNFQAL